ncbi:MAG: 2-oxoacid:acceptor oxidoreductase family protein, partial [Ruminiclostridium sp.]|nr:2-oxoacid:acceptor oxidoreductase family protein [Ruminiclostridium sp.]
MGVQKYPEELTGKIRAKGVDITAIDALSLAEKAGSPKAVNVVLMGLISRTAGFPEEAWQAALEACVPKKALEINRKAFALGRES